MKENQIRLGGEVIVSDPCYEIPTWCQEVIKNVRPGVYDTEVIKQDFKLWGERVTHLTVLHESIKSPIWEFYSNNIGVDSGQCGVFCMTSYRNNDIAKNLDWVKGTPSYDWMGTELHEEWYEKITDRTAQEEQWGVYDTGVVTSSGVGDGQYLLQTCEMDGLIHGFKITFIDEQLQEEMQKEEENEWAD